MLRITVLSSIMLIVFEFSVRLFLRLLRITVFRVCEERRGSVKGGDGGQGDDTEGEDIVGDLPVYRGRQRRRGTNIGSVNTSNIKCRLSSKLTRFSQLDDWLRL